MKHLTFGTSNVNHFDTAILIRDINLRDHDVQTTYIDPLVNQGIDIGSLIAFSLSYTDAGKITIKHAREYLDKLLKALDHLHVTNILVADGTYFKALTKVGKIEPHHGYILPCRMPGYEHMNIVLSMNYSSLFYNPQYQDKIDMSISTMANHVLNTHIALGANIIHSANYPREYEDIAAALRDLHQYDVLTCDIEGFGLGLETCGIATIAFAWDQHNGVAFPVDFDAGHRLENPLTRRLLKAFLDEYQGKLIYHGASFDIKHLIYNLYMHHPLDNDGLLLGLETLTRCFGDTMVLTYLATNSTAGNTLGLKPNSHEYTGNYAQEDIHDISRIPEPELLKYNLIDCLATWFVHNKYMPTVIADNQMQIHDEIMIPSLKVIINMELIGMPLDMQKVSDAHKQLRTLVRVNLDYLNNSPIIRNFTDRMQKEEMVKKNLLLKVKVKPIEDFHLLEFNPNSDNHRRRLLADDLDIKLTKTTDTGLLSTKTKILEQAAKNLINQFNLSEEDIT